MLHSLLPYRRLTDLVQVCWLLVEEVEQREEAREDLGLAFSISSQTEC